MGLKRQWNGILIFEGNMRQKQIWEEIEDTESLEILTKIRRLYIELSIKMKEKWNRHLPLEELLFDRWERARQLGFGEGTNVYHNSYVYGNVNVGKNTWIGPFTLLDGSGGLEIGDYCNISTGVQIYTHDTVKQALSGGILAPERASVKIGNNCYIGPQTVITKGVIIGDHSVIGACSFVNHNIPSNSIVIELGKIIGKVFIEGETISFDYSQT